METNKLVRREILGYFNYHDWQYKETITKVETTETDNGLKIIIELYRPGFLIGYHGEFINGLELWLKKELNREDIAIIINECKLWSNLHY